MGPLDFSKFKVIKRKYVPCFDVQDILNQLNQLKASYPAQFHGFLKLIDSEKKLKAVIGADNVKLKKLKGKFDSCGIAFQYDKCLTDTDCGACIPCKNNKQKRDFHRQIIKIFNYDGKGRKSIRKFYYKIGIKTCYICNAQYALMIEPENKTAPISNKNRYAAKFQLDHYLPQAEYPALSISLCNLFPVCSSCNTIKTKNELGIDYFSTDPAEWDGKFTFNIVEKSLTHFLLKGKPMKIDFIDKHNYNGLDPLSDRFDIKGIYNTQTDLLEELILRKLKYSTTYKGKLANSFPGLFKSINIEERIELGTYSKKDGIHKRPMSKFLQDIDKQLSDHFQKVLANKNPI